MGDARGRDRGVRLRDLEKGTVYLLGYVGRRWEVLGPAPSSGPARPLQAATAMRTDGAGRLRPSTSAERAATGRHAAPDPDLDQDHPL
jgi:hypothetical protein